MDLSVEELENLCAFRDEYVGRSQYEVPVAAAPGVARESDAPAQASFSPSRCRDLEDDGAASSQGQDGRVAFALVNRYTLSERLTLERTRDRHVRRGCASDQPPLVEAGSAAAAELGSCSLTIPKGALERTDAPPTDWRKPTPAQERRRTAGITQDPDTLSLPAHVGAQGGQRDNLRHGAAGRKRRASGSGAAVRRGAMQSFDLRGGIE